MNPDQPLKRSILPLGSRVRFDPIAAPRAAERYGKQVGTVVRRNVRDGEVGIAFGWSAPRLGRPEEWNASGDPIVWAEPRELLEVVRGGSHG